MMKKIIFAFLLLYGYSSIFCYSQTIKQSDFDVDCVVEDFIVKLMNEPYKIEDLKINFPDFYDSIFINMDYNNKVLRNKWERLLLLIAKQIPQDFVCVKDNDLRDEFLKFYKQRMKYQDVKLNEIYSVYIYISECHILNFSFIKKSNNYYLHDLNVNGIYNCEEDPKTLNYEPIEPILPFIYDVINNPNKIKNMGNNYPNFYLAKYLDKEMNDSVYIKNLIFFINDFFNISKTKSEVTYEWKYYDFCHISSEGEGITIKLSKEKNGLYFELININKKFYIKEIRFYFVHPREDP